MSQSPESIRSQIVTTRQECYRSVKSDPHHSLHILPEEFQFCTAAQSFTSTASSTVYTSRSHNPSSSSLSSTQFGKCWAEIHYGLCSGFESFVVETTGTNLDTLTRSPTGRIIYTVPTSSTKNFTVFSPINRTTDSGQNLSKDNYSFKTDNSARNDVHNYGKNVDISMQNNNSSKAQTRQKPNLYIPLNNNNSAQNNNSGFDWSNMPMSPRSMKDRIYSAREDIRQALELLQDDPATPSDDLQSYISDFVREDRLRNVIVVSPSSTNNSRSDLSFNSHPSTSTPPPPSTSQQSNTSTQLPVLSSPTSLSSSSTLPSNDNILHSRNRSPSPSPSNFSHSTTSQSDTGNKSKETGNNQATEAGNELAQAENELFLALMEALEEASKKTKPQSGSENGSLSPSAPYVPGTESPKKTIVLNKNQADLFYRLQQQRHSVNHGHQKYDHNGIESDNKQSQQQQFVSTMKTPDAVEVDNDRRDADNHDDHDDDCSARRRDHAAQNQQQQHHHREQTPDRPTNARMVFGISPRSSSLSRYAHLIEQRAPSPEIIRCYSPQPQSNTSQTLPNRSSRHSLERDYSVPSSFQAKNHSSSSSQQQQQNPSKLESSQNLQNRHSNASRSVDIKNDECKRTPNTHHQPNHHHSRNDDFVGKNIATNHQKSTATPQSPLVYSWSDASSSASAAASPNARGGSRNCSPHYNTVCGGDEYASVDDDDDEELLFDREDDDDDDGGCLVLTLRDRRNVGKVDDSTTTPNCNGNSHSVSLRPSTSPQEYCSSYNKHELYSDLNKNSDIIKNSYLDSQHQNQQQCYHLNYSSPQNQRSIHQDSCPSTAPVNVIDRFISDNFVDYPPTSEVGVGEGEDPFEAMKLQTPQKMCPLTDDEKALLHETLKVGLYGDAKRLDLDADDDGNCDSASQKQTARRIIVVSKPSPKPEAKPEPKFVNGKVVFGQVPVKQTRQRGSVAERVMLFEKCPEKTSVTKHKLTELQSKHRINNVNKIGNWIRMSAEVDTKIPKIGDTTGSVRTGAVAKLVLNNLEKIQAKIEAAGGDEPRSPLTPTSPFRRFSRSNSLVPGQVPRFHFPTGRPYSSTEVEAQIKRISGVFERFPSRTITRKEIGSVLKMAGIPIYWKEPLFRAIVSAIKSMPPILANGGTPNGSRRGSFISSRSNSIDAGNGNGNGNGAPAFVAANGQEFITSDQFIDYWKRLISNCYDESSRFTTILTEGKRQYLLPEDFEALLQDVIDSHPGLAFLKEAEEFHSRYIHTVIARIFYCLDLTWSGQISLSALRKSNFLKVLRALEAEDDINQITDYFSYEHFYVIYCKFWELDADHDLFISKHDLAKHNDSAISSRMIDRIFCGAVTRGSRTAHNRMSYAEFVWFLLSEEDKRHPRSIEYWFRCMDLDGDGFLSMYELEYFYSEQVKRMEAAGIEALPFSDCLCQMMDLASPKIEGKISLSDLKRCKLTTVFFDTFFNLEKYLDHEQRDPFASRDDELLSDWDRYAAEEYELLVAEENAQNGNNYFRHHKSWNRKRIRRHLARQQSKQQQHSSDCQTEDDRENNQDNDRDQYHEEDNDFVRNRSHDSEPEHHEEDYEEENEDDRDYENADINAEDDINQSEYEENYRRNLEMQSKLESEAEDHEDGDEGTSGSSNDAETEEETDEEQTSSGSGSATDETETESQQNSEDYNSSQNSFESDSDQFEPFPEVPSRPQAETEIVTDYATAIDEPFQPTEGCRHCLEEQLNANRAQKAEREDCQKDDEEEFEKNIKSDEQEEEEEKNDGEQEEEELGREFYEFLTREFVLPNDLFEGPKVCFVERCAINHKSDVNNNFTAFVDEFESLTTLDDEDFW